MLTVRVEKSGNDVILYCEGRLVRGNEDALLCSAVHHHGRTVRLDLSRVSAMDAAGIGVLASLQAAGIYMVLANPSAQVLELLKVTKLDSVFEITHFEPTGERSTEVLLHHVASAVA